MAGTPLYSRWSQVQVTSWDLRLAPEVREVLWDGALTLWRLPYCPGAREDGSDR